MIWNFVPYCPRGIGSPVGQDLGLTYDLYMGLVPEGDWACFMDHDASITSRTWYPVLEEAVEKQPDAGAFVAMTNRLNPRKSRWQIAQEADPDNNDMVYHWKIGHAREREYGATLRDVTNIEQDTSYKPLSGFFFCVSKKTWTEFGGCGESGFGQRDWRIHRKIRKAGKRIYVVEGIYFYHWFQFDQKLSGVRINTGKVKIF